jgi:peptidoglycan-associated lipoprotein
MKLAPKTLCLVVATAALFVAGCPQTPTRPDPSATAMGPTPGGRSPMGNSDLLNPLPTNIEQGAPGLEQRGGEFDLNGQNRAALQTQTVYFDFDRSDIKASERPKLQAAKEYLDKNPNHKLLLEGHCDWRGTAEYNLSLGERRANAARAYLVSLGVPAARLETVSKGSLDAAKNADDATMSKDRRVDPVVIDPARVRPGGL